VTTSTWDTLLIANRGEIAVRIIRSAQALGLRTVAVHSDADVDALHVAMADVAVRIGPAPVADSYLDPARILEAARQTGAQAIHPGYGFLSENADFARAVEEAGLVWVGPPASAIADMGDKAAAKVRMRAAGVPVVPGFDGDDPSDVELVEAAEQVGYPLLVKASAGGGGRGMRMVQSPAELTDAIKSARAEAGAAFGSTHLLLERLVLGARHIEIQVFADSHGKTLHLGERDCSVQRRNQKVVEEAPSPAVSPALRHAMGRAACAAAQAVGYVGAGTVEFLLDGDGESFYFLEMNTRLQVEHPVTEEVTGFDLVEWQLRAAMGQHLPVSQEDVRLNGHSIEVRLYCEDPGQGYLPQPGPYALWSPPQAIRVDHGLAPSGEISPHYDPMVAKLIAHGPDRDTARRRLLRALEDSIFFGGRTNRSLLQRVLASEDFAQGRATTRWLDAHPELAQTLVPSSKTLATAIGVWVCQQQLPAQGTSGFRSAHLTPQQLDASVNGERVAAEVTMYADRVQVTVDGTEADVALLPGAGPRRRVRVDAQRRTVHLHAEYGQCWIGVDGHVLQVTRWDPSPQPEDAAAGGSAVMPMAGKVLSIDVAVGDAVVVGQVLARVEAMKLETTLRAGVDGEVTEICAAAGDSASAGTVLVRVEPT
jgi:geranyl-CoA carboxylase alpha subunit